LSFAINGTLQAFSSAPRMLVPVQTIEEIAADQTLALAVQKRYVRVRDIFDLAFFGKKRNTKKRLGSRKGKPVWRNG
jgi:hypothetical protein